MHPDYRDNGRCSRDVDGIALCCTTLLSCFSVEARVLMGLSIGVMIGNGWWSCDKGNEGGTSQHNGQALVGSSSERFKERLQALAAPKELGAS